MNLCGDILQSSPSLPALQFGKIKHMGSSVIMINIATNVIIVVIMITNFTNAIIKAIGIAVIRSADSDDDVIPFLKIILVSTTFVIITTILSAISLKAETSKCP